MGFDMLDVYGFGLEAFRFWRRVHARRRVISTAGFDRKMERRTDYAKVERASSFQCVPSSIRITNQTRSPTPPVDSNYPLILILPVQIPLWSSIPPLIKRYLSRHLSSITKPKTREVVIRPNIPITRARRSTEFLRF